MGQSFLLQNYSCTTMLYPPNQISPYCHHKFSTIILVYFRALHSLSLFKQFTQSQCVLHASSATNISTLLIFTFSINLWTLTSFVRLPLLNPPCTSPNTALFSVYSCILYLTVIIHSINIILMIARGRKLFNSSLLPILCNNVTLLSFHSFNVSAPCMIPLLNPLNLSISSTSGAFRCSAVTPFNYMSKVVDNIVVRRMMNTWAILT